MNIRLNALCLGGFLALTSFLAQPVKADEWNKKTEFQFSAPVEIPGKVLAPGKYVFQLVDSDSDRNIVQVFSEAAGKTRWSRPCWPSRTICRKRPTSRLFTSTRDRLEPLRRFIATITLARIPAGSSSTTKGGFADQCECDPAAARVETPAAPSYRRRPK